jgi:ABC-2 type transport system permease protein
MAGFPVLLRKEIRGTWRTHRVLIVLAVFLLLGLGTPLLLNYIEAFLPGEESGVVMPEFTATDVAAEYLESMGQIGLIVVILVAMGAVAKERESGTAAMTLSKPVGTGSFIGAKLMALVLVLAVGFAAGALGCYLYTVILFGDLDAWRFFLAALVAALYLLVCLAATLMYSSLFRSQLAAGGLALLTMILLTATSGLPVMEDYGPGTLLSWSGRILAGTGPDVWGAVAAGLGLVVATTLLGWQTFKRKEL